MAANEERYGSVNGFYRVLDELDGKVFIEEPNGKRHYICKGNLDAIDNIVDKLNRLSEKLYEEQCRARPVTLTTHISDEDWKKFKKLFEKYCDNGGDY